MSETPTESISLGACPTCGGPAQFIDPGKVRAVELVPFCVDDIRWLIDIRHWGKPHMEGCSWERKTGPCDCRLGMLRRRYGHWPANGKPETDAEWAIHREQWQREFP